jgi:ribosomal protein S1
VNVGGKGEATIDVGELKNDEGVLDVAVGDSIQATVVSTSGGLTLSRRLALGAATARQLEDAFRAGLPVEGKVEQAVKGGYQVRAGRVTRIAPFGAFVELEPGIEGLAHASTFAPTEAPGGWSASVTPGMTGAFEILSIEPEKKRIGVALVEEGSSRSEAVLNAGGAAQEVPDARDDTAREDAAKAQSFGSLADKLRGALAPREK